MENNKKLSVTKAYASLCTIGLVLAFAIIVCFSSAWFSQNEKVNGNGASVAIKSDDSIYVDSFDIVKYLSEETFKGAVCYTDDPLSPEHMVLNAFDTVFEERQANTPLVLRIPVKSVMGRRLRITFSCYGGLLADGIMDGNLSNVLDIRCAVNNALTAEMNSVTDNQWDDFYTNAKAYFQDSANMSLTTVANGKYTEDAFVNYTVEGGFEYSATPKDTEFSFTIENPDSADTLDVFVYIAYDAQLIDKYTTDTNETGHVDFELENAVEFIRDFTEIKFEAID